MQYLRSFVPATFVGNHDVTRLATRISDGRHLAHALVILLTLGGTPFIYAGDEQAFQGLKEDRPGGDDEIRPPFPPTPEQLAPYGWDTYRLHQRLIGLRRRHPWLHRAPAAPVDLGNAHISYRVEGDGETLLVALSLNVEAATIRVPDALALKEGSGSLRNAGSAEATVRHGWAILSTSAPDYGSARRNT